MLPSVIGGPGRVLGLHPMILSARASSDCGTSSPSALAVLRLIASSYLVGACTGFIAGYLPLRKQYECAGNTAGGHWLMIPTRQRGIYSIAHKKRAIVTIAIEKKMTKIESPRMARLTATPSRSRSAASAA
jgi:hypothetical protein